MHPSSVPKHQLWERRFRQFENSPLSVTDFCDSVGCSTTSFYQWKRKLESKSRTDNPVKSHQATFLQVQSHPDAVIEIKLHSGIVISVPVEAISYNRKKARKPRQLPQDALPAHLPREEVEVAIPQAFQDRIDSGELFIKNYQYSETLKHIPAKMVVLRSKMPVLAFVDNPEQTMLVESEANLGEKGRYHPLEKMQEAKREQKDSLDARSDSSCVDQPAL